jgi:predicted RNA binding protein YcfA (HicA-like mRNA interferase family)
MPLNPVSRRKLIQNLRALGFQGPYAGGKHEYMLKEQTRLAIPNPHTGDIGRALLARILRQANISQEEWEQL